MQEARIAKLTDDEIIALRLYTSPCQYIINKFLQKLRSSSTRYEALTDEETYAQTVRNILSGFEKLTRIEDSKKSDVQISNA